MKDHVHIICILSFILFTTCTGPASSFEKNKDSSSSENLPGYTANLGKCRITITGASVWRDWMPIVEHPGPDGGSPLHARIKIWLDNSAGELTRLSFQAVITDDKAHHYALPLHILPNFRVLPESIRKSFNSLDEEARKKSISKYNVVWNGVLKKGETREVEFASAEGPYIPAGYHVYVEMTMTDQKGNSQVLKSSESIIGRTD
jgi:hypothetical protein